MKRKPMNPAQFARDVTRLYDRVENGPGAAGNAYLDEALKRDAQRPAPKPTKLKKG